MNIVNLIAEKNLVKAEKLFLEQMDTIARKKLLEVKKMIAAKLDEDLSSVFDRGPANQDSSILRNAANRTYMNNNRSAARPAPMARSTSRPSPTGMTTARPTTATVKPPAPKSSNNDLGGTYDKATGVREPARPTTATVKPDNPERASVRPGAKMPAAAQQFGPRQSPSDMGAPPPGSPQYQGAKEAGAGNADLAPKPAATPAPPGPAAPAGIGMNVGAGLRKPADPPGPAAASTSRSMTAAAPAAAKPPVSSSSPLINPVNIIGSVPKDALVTPVNRGSVPTDANIGNYGKPIPGLGGSSDRPSDSSTSSSTNSDSTTRKQPIKPDDNTGPMFESLRNKLKLLEAKKMISAGITDHKGYLKAIKKATLKHRENEKKYPTVKDKKK